MKIPWPKRMREAMEADLDNMPPLPIQQVIPLPSAKEASVPEDTVSNGDNLVVLAKAHEIVSRIQAERDADKAQIGKLQGDMAEVLLLLESEKRKVSVLELDLATAANNAQALASQVQEMRQLLSLFRHAMDRWEIKAPPKTPRKPKVKTGKLTTDEHGVIGPKPNG